MSVRRQFLLALKALVNEALPLCRVAGFEEDCAKPGRSDPGGDVLGWPGEIEEIESCLSPYTRLMRHSVPLEMLPPEGVADRDLWLDDSMRAVGTAVLTEAEGSLFDGLVCWLEVAPPSIEIVDAEGSPSRRWAGLTIIAEYWVRDPLNA